MKRLIRIILLTALLAALALGVAPAPPARAAAFVVTNTDDSGPGSLRQAILDASPAGPGINVWTSHGPYGGLIAELVIDPITSTTIYAVLGSGIIRSANAGGTWSQVNVGPTNDGVGALVIDAVSPATLYAGTAHGVFKSTNGAASWVAVGLGNSLVVALAIDRENPGTVYAATYTDGVYKTSDGGMSWRAANAGLYGYAVNALAIDPRTPTTVYAAAYSYDWSAPTPQKRGIFKSSNGGESWSPANTGLPSTAFTEALAIDPADPAILYAGTNAGIFKSTDASRTWGQVLGDSVNVLVIDPTNPTIVYAGSGLGVIKTSDGGKNWRLNTGVDTVSTLAIDPNHSATVYAGKGYGFHNFDGGVFKSTNGGESWVAVGLVSNVVAALVIDPATPTTLYAGTDGSGVFKSTDSGESWVGSGLGDDSIGALAISPADPAMLYAGTKTGVFKSTDGGENWVAVGPSLGPITVLRIDPANATVVYAATYGGVYKTIDAGESWSRLSLCCAEDLVIDPVTPTTLYAASGGVYKSTDGGESWVDTGLSTTYPVDTLAIDPAIPAIVYAGTIGWSYYIGSLHRTTDGGASWSPLASGALYSTMHALAVDPATPNTVYVGGGNLYIEGGVFKSTDRGNSWSKLGDSPARILALALDPANPAIVYAGMEGGGVYRIEQSFSVDSASPGLGLTGGGTTVAIRGGNFMPGATVTMGGVAAGDVTLVNTGLLTATTGAHVAGAVDVVVTSPDDRQVTLPHGFVYADAIYQDYMPLAGR